MKFVLTWDKTNWHGDWTTSKKKLITVNKINSSALCEKWHVRLFYGVSLAQGKVKNKYHYMETDGIRGLYPEYFDRVVVRKWIELSWDQYRINI